MAWPRVFKQDEKTRLDGVSHMSTMILQITQQHYELNAENNPYFMLFCVSQAAGRSFTAAAAVVVTHAPRSSY